MSAAEEEEYLYELAATEEEREEYEEAEAMEEEEEYEKGEEKEYEEAETMEEEDEEGEEEEVYEFGDGDEAMQWVERAESGAGAGEFHPNIAGGVPNYEELAARKRKELAEEHPDRGKSSKKPRQDELLEAATVFDELMESLGLRRKRRSKDPKKRGRRKGSRNKLSPEVSRKIAGATLHFASGEYKEAIPILHEVVRIAPNLPDAYYLLGKIYKEMGEKDKALNFLMLAAYVSPKDASLWKTLVAWACERKDAALARHCVLKAMRADANDAGLKFDGASIYSEVGNYQKAAELYEQILGIHPSNTGACKAAAKMYRKCGQIERAINVLEKFANVESANSDSSVLNLLISLYLENNAHNEALRQIEKARLALGSRKKLPVELQAKAVICHAYLGDMKHAEVFLQDARLEASTDDAEFITEVANSLENLGRYEYALKFYLLLEDIAGDKDGSLCVKVARCYISIGEQTKAIPYFYKALRKMEDNVDIRITLSSLLLDADKSDEAIILLSPPKNSDLLSSKIPAQPKPWWLDGKVKMQLAKIYHDRGMLENFASTIFSSVLETLNIEYANRKVRQVKRLPNTVLYERTKVLGEQRPDSVFHGFRPIASPAELQKATRAKKLLEKRAALNQDAENDVLRRTKQEPPLPGLLTSAENYQLILNLCRALASLQRYWEALQIINRTLKVANDAMSDDNREELRSLGAQIAYRAPDPRHGFNYVRYVVQQHPYTLSAWNCYYKVASRLDDRFSRHFKFLLRVRAERRDCVPPIIISGHRFTAISQHQAAARDYLEAYKLEPENPLINLCVGTALINLAPGFRLQNKNQCIVQAFAFLYRYLRLCGYSQEALYNVARAYHHVGLNTLAAIYYEKALATEEEDHPIPKLPYEDSGTQEGVRPGYCDLRREAAYNLHLIYKKSGAPDLARRILKTYCTV